MQSKLGVKTVIVAVSVWKQMKLLHIISFLIYLFNYSFEDSNNKNKIINERDGTSSNKNSGTEFPGIKKNPLNPDKSNPNIQPIMKNLFDGIIETSFQEIHKKYLYHSLKK